MKNPLAVALGKLAKGIPKNYSAAERERRRRWAAEMRKRKAAKRAGAPRS